VKRFEDLGFWWKTICIVIIILAVAIYCNIGYWGGKSFYSGLSTQFSEKQLMGFQKFQLATWEKQLSQKHAFASDESKNKSRRGSIIYLSVIAWPIGLAGSLGTWFVKFVFLGDLFKVIF